MMLTDELEKCCNIAIAALDGVYGWASEVISIALFVFIFNFLVKKALTKLHKRYRNQGNTWKDSLVMALYDPLWYFVWFFAAIQALNLISTQVYHEIIPKTRHTIIAIAAALSLAWFLLKWKGYVVKHTVARSKNKEIAFDPGKIEALDKLATAAILFFTILIIMEITGSSLTTLIALSGVGGLAIAFASQEITANFFGGFMIYLTHPFTIGDTIQIPDAQIEGVVEKIGWYMTEIRSLDKRPIYIPNSIFSKRIIVTPSRMSHRQIKEVIGLRYEDISRIHTVLTQLRSMIKNHPDLDPSQPQMVHLTGLGEHSINLSLNLFTLTTNHESFLKIKEEILLKITDLLSSLGAELATPMQNIAIINEVKIKN